MARTVRISLANKCQLLFGFAVVLILTAALAVGGLRMRTLVREGQQDAARRLADAWLTGVIELGSADVTAWAESAAKLSVVIVGKNEFNSARQSDPFLAQAIDVFENHQDRSELFRFVRAPGAEGRYRYARAVRHSDLNPSAQPATDPELAAAMDVSAVSDPLDVIFLIEFDATLAQQQLLLNRVYLVAAGLFAGLLAIGVFWFITRRIILSPVRVLRETAAKVSGGDINIRSDINTGDEFEQLSDVFNTMLENLKENQDELRSVNKSLDLKLGELGSDEYKPL